VVVVVVVFIPAPVLQLPPIELKSMEKSELSLVGERGKKKFVLCLCHVEVAGTHTTKD
jgi:hypothetical protein